MIRKVLKVLKVLVIVAVVCVVAGFVVMRLWNWLMPEIFGLKIISFAQALGLLILSKILLGGLHRHAEEDVDGNDIWKSVGGR